MPAAPVRVSMRPNNRPFEWSISPDYRHQPIDLLPQLFDLTP
jgi:hypothetical protein